MRTLLKVVGIAMAALALTAGSPGPVGAQTKPTLSQSKPSKTVTHRVVIQITESDPAVMNLALNNAQNLVKYFEGKGEKIEIEFVTYGPGLDMVRSDTSPVKDRLAAISANMKNVTFTGCGNTLAKQSTQENKTISLVPEARLVPAGIARIVELEEQGWTYLRP